MRIIEIITDCGHVDTLRGLAQQHALLDFWATRCEHDSRCAVHMLVRPGKQQKVLDAVQAITGSSENSRVVIVPVEATIPRPDTETDREAQKRSTTRSREELYQTIISGIKLDSTFIWMVVLSTIVASIGLLTDNVAIVIGAMVIAPLLGPNLALAFASALGDGQLVLQSLKTSVTGIGVALLISVAIGYVGNHSGLLRLDAAELLLRTDVGYGEVILALVSGAAAVLSLASGWHNSLVGVMVAVALLPPTATFGMMLGAGRTEPATGAALLLALNIVCVNLSAKLAFVAKGVRPRTWLEKNKARQSVRVAVIFWVVVLVLLISFMQLWHGVLSF